MPQVRMISAAALGAMIVAGCTPQTIWQPTVDTYGNSNAQYLSRDLEECRALALSSSGRTEEQAFHGGAIGAIAGAAGGLLVGGMIGRPGRGAALGAAMGGAAGAGTSAVRTEEQFKRTFDNCLRNRGHNVIS